jgi:hypothetical protein
MGSLNRAVVALAMRTHIPVATWLAEDDPRVMATAFDLAAQEDEQLKKRR